MEEGGSYWVRVIDQNGCTAADSLTVTEICPTRYYIPNVFSPNDDGDNDYFEVYSRDMISLKLYVYDRWGNELFESSDINARDGTAPTGENPSTRAYSSGWRRWKGI